jgi:Protein of unknown function (DUF1329)
MKTSSQIFSVLVLASLLGVSSTEAAVTAQEAQKLESVLTPLGGERAGNADGSIPEWKGGITKSPFANYVSGQHHPDPFNADKPLYVITSQNMSAYADKLAEGQKALFRAYPQSFRMMVYPSRRSAAVPAWVAANTAKCAVTAKLKEWGMEGCVGGTPFPIPSGNAEEKAQQIMWNHILRYRGVYIVRKASEVAVQRNGSYALGTSQQEVDFRYYRRDIKTTAQLNNVIFYYLSFTTAPARLAGGAVLIWETLDQRKEQRQAWGYNAGQRRVRQAPNLAYDTPIAAADGLRTADDTDMYNGAMDKYEWRLIGKKEILIPYNNYRVGLPEVKYKNLLTPGHLNPDFLRYELHRVWVVEGNLKPGEHHLYSKRRFYIDEDSWGIAIADQYDARGELWRVSMAYLKNYYDLPTVWTAVDVFHDLQARRYNAQNLVNEEPAVLDVTKPSPGDEYFTPAALRRRGIR